VSYLVPETDPPSTEHQRPRANRVAHLNAILHALHRHRRTPRLAAPPTRRRRRGRRRTSPPLASSPTYLISQSRYLRLRFHGHGGSLTLLACLLALPLAALLWAILSFTVAIATFCFVGAADSANVHTRALLATVLGVLLALAVLTLLVFWDAWREQPTSEPEEDYARGVGAGRELVREGWLTNKVRRINIARAQVMDGIRARVTKTKTAVGQALSIGRTTNEKGSAKESGTSSV
jgi:hypothetical protein